MKVIGAVIIIIIENIEMRLVVSLLSTSLLSFWASLKSTKTDCGHLNGRIFVFKTVMYAKISSKMVNLRDIAGEHRRRRVSLKTSREVVQGVLVQTR